MMEQRRNPRFHAQFRSSFSSITMVGGEGVLVDLSVRGCRIESSTEVQPGTSLEVRIAVIEHEHPIHIQGALVRWSRAGQFGLEFEVISPIEWTYLEQIVNEIEMEPYERDKEAADRNDPA
jgi:hypothetical protein